MCSPWVDLTTSEDGRRKMCCICLEWVDVDKLYTDEDGTKWDLCSPTCAADAGIC